MKILERLGKWLAKVQEPDVSVEELLAMDTPKHVVEEWQQNASPFTDYTLIVSGSRVQGDFDVQSCGVSEAEALGLLDMAMDFIRRRGIKTK